MGKSILFLSRTFPPLPGAVGHLVAELGGALGKAGHQVTVVTSGGKQNEAEGNAIRVVRVGGLPFSRKNHLLRAFSYLSLYPAMLWAVIKLGRQDIVVTTTDPPLQAVLGMFIKWVSPSKLVHWSQDMYPEMAEEAGVLRKNGPFANLLRWISTTALQQHDQVISIGRCMTDRLLTRGLAPEKITEIANWTDPLWIQPVPEANNEFWKQQNLAGRFVVVYSGNLGLAHSFTEILAAAEILHKSTPDVLFLFIGEGPRRAQAEMDAATLSLSNIRFLPAQSWKSLPQSLSAGQVHLVSLRENLSGLVVPSKFYGGMAAGRPCIFIGPPESEVARLIVENHVGKIIPAGATDSLVEAILDYRNNPEICRVDSQRARDLGERATLQIATDKFLKIIPKV